MPGEQSGDGQANEGSARPESRADYVRWLKEGFGVEVDNRLEERFEAVVNKVKRDFEASELWRQVCANLNDYDSGYRIGAQNYPLFLDGGKPPTLETKSFESFLLKTYRRNISENGLWPEPPKDGWVMPDDGFAALNDLVRTSFVVKYLDGVEFLAERLQQKSRDSGCRCTLEFEARMEGHYAAHLCIRDTFQIPDNRWDIEAVSMSVEIQIITQLQEVIRRLTHQYYEERREQPVKARSNWQWDYRSDEFTANYLGHILHYVEGMIMEVRTRQRDGEKGLKAW